MPKQPRMNAREAESLLFNGGFTLIRTQGRHRIYFKAGIRVLVPFHAGKILHPKIIKQIIQALDTAEPPE